MQNIIQEKVAIVLETLNQNHYTKQVLSYFILVRDAFEQYDYESVQWKDFVLKFMVGIFLWEMFLE
jgi:hypothetical protein